MTAYVKGDTKCKHVIGGSGGKRQSEKHHYDTGISDISLAVRRKVKQRDVMNVLKAPETYSFLKTEISWINASSTEVKRNLVIILIGVVVNFFTGFDT